MRGFENLDEVIKVESVSESSQCRAECQSCREGFRTVSPSDRSPSDLTNHICEAEGELAEFVHRFLDPKPARAQGEGLVKLFKIFGLAMYEHIPQAVIERFLLNGIQVAGRDDRL